MDVPAMSTGAEGVETAINASANGATCQEDPDGRHRSHLRGQFPWTNVAHRRFSTEPNIAGPFRPYSGGFVHVPFGDAKALAAAITPDTAAFLVEPVQGEAGIIVPPEGYLTEVARICREKNVLLIVD